MSGTAIAESDICNQALGLIGQKEQIASLSEPSTASRMCKVFYAPARDAVLERFPWPFASKHTFLALLPASRTGWANMYALPADCIAARFVSNGQRPGATLPFTAVVALDVTLWNNPPQVAVGPPIPFTVEASDDGNGQVLLTDQPGAELIYTTRITTPGAFPALFVRALRYLLAADLAACIPGKGPLEDMLRKRFEVEIATAGAASFRQTKEDPAPDAPYITIRG